MSKEEIQTTDEDRRAAKLATPVSEIPITMKLIDRLANLPSMPKHYQGKPQEILAATFMGREIGIGPVTSWNNIDIIEGSVSMRAKLMSALVLRAGHVIVIEEQTAEVARLKCLRYHKQTNQLLDVGTVEYTKQDAETAGNDAKQNYEQHPKAMLTNRALTLACRTVFSDALMGFAYVGEELGTSEVEEIPEFGEVDVTDLEAAEANVSAVIEAEVVDA